MWCAKKIKITKEQKKEHYISVYKELSETHQVAFMRELFKSALRRVENDIDGDKVEDWVIKIEKLYFKINIWKI